jgi:RNA polymerase sigma-70 factor (ECF subfamily)
VAALARAQFLDQLEAALARLPAKQGRAFVMCEGLEHETGEVCKALGVTPNHLGVILHRARARLRAAVAPQWRGAAPLLA